ncbi:MAG: hypothetical protein NVS1B12_04890 [Acidimicrobiales bacterium]
MRRLYEIDDLSARGMTPAAIKWGQRSGRWRRVERGVRVAGADAPSPLEQALAGVVATGGVASGTLAGVLLGLDAVEFQGPDLTVSPTGNGRRPGARRRLLAPDRITTVGGIRTTTGLQTLIDLSAEVDDDRWEQALESALRRRLTTIADVERAARGSHRGVKRMRRVLSRRPAGAPHTESILETRMIQLARSVPSVPEPTRQLRISTAGGFVARVDLAWPALGLFVELDGQHHKDQPVYDARRETAIVAATGWLCGRFTWREVVRVPVVTSRRLEELVAQARRRPIPPEAGSL